MNSKKKKIIKWSALSLLSLALLIAGFGAWFISLLPPVNQDLKTTKPESLTYLTENVPENRGKILAVVTSADQMGSSGKATGYELTELSRAYYVFQANGFTVDIASPKGGNPSMITDGDDMGAFDFAFLNDKEAQYKATHTIPMNEVRPEDYAGVYFVGGKGAMFDFPDNESIQSLVREYYHEDKVIGAVCHGPAALVNVTLNDGRPLLQNKQISSFTNEEELFLIPDATTIFPFMLQSKLTEQGAVFNNGTMYLENVVHDANLVTGQNPWSTWTLAETMIQQMGYMPKKREVTEEEQTINVLVSYEAKGYSEAKKEIKDLYLDQGKTMDRMLLAMHGIVAVMQWKPGKAVNMIRLLAYAKSVSE